MKASKAGLVSAGGVSKLFLARMPSLLGAIGPVKASSIRVARRIANSLRAGSPVAAYAELSKCGLLWVALPEAALDGVLIELAAEVWLGGKMIIVCGAARGSSSFRFLTEARLATLNAIPGDERTLIAEGDAAALRELRRVASADRRKLIEIAPAAKASYLAGVHSASDLLLPYFAVAVELFRAAGFARTEATRIAEGLASRAVRAYAKAGTKAWSEAAALDLRQSLERDLASLLASDPRRAALYENGIARALNYFADEPARAFKMKE